MYILIMSHNGMASVKKKSKCFRYATFFQQYFKLKNLLQLFLRTPCKQYGIP